MTEAEKAAALADEIELGKETTGDDSAEIALVVRSLRRLAETEARPAGDLREVAARALARRANALDVFASSDPMAADLAEAFRHEADDVFHAIAAAGYAVVPREPTEEMVEAAERAAWKHIYIGEDSDEEPVITGVDKGMRAALRAAIATKEAGR